MKFNIIQNKCLYLSSIFLYKLLQRPPITSSNYIAYSSNTAKDDRHRGNYKKFANSVEAFCPDGKNKELHPLLVIATFVIVFLHIHPFQDDNGRLARAHNFATLAIGITAYVPYSSFERVIEENKDSYYLALCRGQAELEEVLV